MSNAGGLGVLGMGGLPAPVVRSEIRRTRDLTPKPFGLNLLLPFLEEGQLETCLDEASRRSCCSGGATPHLQVAHCAGVKVVPQVGSVEEGQGRGRCRSRRGDDPGRRSGRSRRGTAALQVLLPAVVDAVSPLPVVAAGGVANGRGVAAALMLGAEAVSMGTRFVCSDEAALARLQGASSGLGRRTPYTLLFDVGWPDAAHRVLRAALEAWEAAGRPASGQRPGEGAIVGRYSVAGQVIDVQKCAVDPPMADFDGDIEQTALYCGQSCSPCATSARPPTS